MIKDIYGDDNLFNDVDMAVYKKSEYTRLRVY